MYGWGGTIPSPKRRGGRGDLTPSKRKYEMDSGKNNVVPQAGESRTESPDSVCPSVSGGGTKSIGGQITPDPRERRPLAKETDLPTTPRYLELTTEACTPKRYDAGRRELRDRPPRAPLTMASPSDMSDDTEEEEEEEDYEETDVCTRSSSRSSGEELLEELDELVPMTSAEKRGARVAVAARKPSSLPQRDERGRFLPKKSAAPLPLPLPAPLPEAASKRSGKRAPDWTPPERSDRPPSKLTREGEMEETARLAAEARRSLGVEEAVLLQRPTAAALRKRVVEDAEIVATVAAKSGNLKGTFQGALKDAAASIKAAMGMLQESDATLEVKKLQAENEALRAQLDHLRREMIDMRSEVLQARARPPPTPPAAAAQPPTPPFNEAAILEAIERRFEALERRICPPAAADGAAAPQRTVEGPSAPPPTGEQGREARRKRKKKGASRAVPVADLPAVTPGGPQEAAPSAPPTWAEVAANKKKRRPNKKAKKKKKPSAANLQVPQTAAVVLTLQPEAKERGVTYASVFNEAKARIDLGSLDIHALRFRLAATGARILELPGAGCGKKAEALAERLRQELDPGVRISTPTKGAELRITGLDDSSTAADVAAAIARATDCPEADIRVGEIRFARGRGAVWVRCPIAAAKTLSEKGQVTVGWVSARAVLLQPKPARCYRCLRPGHMAPQCTSEVDRSALCFRCSQPGHRAGQCTAAPHCGVCAEGKRPADHAVGSKACKPGPRPKKGPQGAG